MDLKMMTSIESLLKTWTKLSAVTLFGLATLLPSFGYAKASRSDGYSMKMYCKFEVFKKKTHVGKNWKSESLMTQTYEKNFTVGFQSYVVTSNKDDWNRAVNIFSDAERAEIVNQTNFPLYAKMRLIPDTFRGKQGLNWEISFHKYNRFEETRTSPFLANESPLGTTVYLQDRLPNGKSIKLTCY